MREGEVLRRHHDGAVEEAPFLHALMGVLGASAHLDAVLDAWAPEVPPPAAAPVGEPTEDPPALVALLGLLALRLRITRSLEREVSAAGNGPSSSAPPGTLPAAPRELLR